MTSSNSRYVYFVANPSVSLLVIEVNVNVNQITPRFRCRHWPSTRRTRAPCPTWTSSTRSTRTSARPVRRRRPSSTISGRPVPRRVRHRRSCNSARKCRSRRSQWPPAQGSRARAKVSTAFSLLHLFVNFISGDCLCHFGPGMDRLTDSCLCFHLTHTHLPLLPSVPGALINWADVREKGETHAAACVGVSVAHEMCSLFLS